MKEAFRIWFKIEISLFSVPVVLVGAIIPLVIFEKDAPIETLLGLGSVSLSCFLALFSVINLMLYTFGGRNTEFPKITAVCLFYWLVNWLFVAWTVIEVRFGLLSIGMLLPVLVLLHLTYLSRRYFGNAT